MQPNPLEKVIWGFGQYVLSSADMPTPSDIVKIIDPRPLVWRPNKAYYIKLQQIYKDQGSFGLDNEEIEYVRRYEKHMRAELTEAR
jgi:hypothetical protein